MRSERLQVLLVEDNPGDARLIREMLHEAGAGQLELARVERLDEALKCLDEDAFDVLVLDLNLPNSHGFNTFVRVRAQVPEMPIVVLTGLADEALGIEAVKGGAQDYLVKGQVDGNLLVRTLRYAIERKGAEEELRKHRDHLEDLVQKRTAELVRSNEQLRQEITERKRAEEALKEYSERLEAMVEERTAELNQRVAEVEQLNRGMANVLKDLRTANRVTQQTARHLEEANAELEAFAYSVSHDLRAPLRAINGFAQIIARRHRDSLPQEGQHYFDNIVEASEHMAQLIDDLLLYSRLGRTAVRHQQVPLGDLLARVTDDLAGQVAETKAHLSFPDDPPTVHGDPTLLGQIFTNLLDNALTYHHAGVPPQIVVNYRAAPNHVIVSVADNGIGIPAEFHDKIFNIFQRLHSQDEYPGTGIGLAIVKRAAELLDGQVWVESVVGEGSTFYVQLPVISNI